MSESDSREEVIDAFKWVLGLGDHADGAVGDDGGGNYPFDHSMIFPRDDTAATGGLASSGDTNDVDGITTAQPEPNLPPTHTDGSFEVYFYIDR